LDNLVKDIKAHGNRLTTGDIGNRYLFQTLAANGLNELMYKMFNHEEAPGYGFQLKYGATSLTEHGILARAHRGITLCWVKLTNGFLRH